MDNENIFSADTDNTVIESAETAESSDITDSADIAETADDIDPINTIGPINEIGEIGTIDTNISVDTIEVPQVELDVPSVDAIPLPEVAFSDDVQNVEAEEITAAGTEGPLYRQAFDAGYAAGFSAAIATDSSPSPEFRDVEETVPEEPATEEPIPEEPIFEEPAPEKPSKDEPAPTVFSNPVTAATDEEPGKNLAIASLVLGLISVIFPHGNLSLFCLVCAIIGLVLSHNAGKQGNTTTLCKAGQILSIIGVILCSLRIASAIACYSCMYACSSPF